MAGLASVLPDPVPVVLDKERSLLYDLAAFAYLERRYENVWIEVEDPEYAETHGKKKVNGLPAAMEKLQNDSFVALVDFLYAGLKHEVREPLGTLPGGRYAGEDLTPEIVERMLAPVNVMELQEPLTEALNRATSRPTVPATKVNPKVATLPTAGIGSGTTTSEPSSAGEVMPSSGE